MLRYVGARVEVVFVASALALTAVLLGWRGSDLPAQIFRADLVRHEGFTLWNNQWFGGHPTLSYSVLSPLVDAILGPVLVGALCGIASAFLFERILSEHFGRRARIGALWFATATVTNLIVGRVAFAFGVTLALAAVFALQRSHPIVATICAAATSLASPVAGAFLLLTAVAWFAADRERRLPALAMFFGAAAPLAVLGLLFPPDGVEPFKLWNLIVDVLLCSLIFVAARRARALQWGAALYAIAVVGAFLVPTALGGNINRFAQYFAGPLLACLLLPRYKRTVAALAAPLVLWQWYPAFDAIAVAGRDPSTKQEYYEPLVHELERASSGPVGRVEIPSTSRHWEAAYVAPKVLLARGWERQRDIAYNPIFYDAPLNASSYRHWLAENTVEFVALPDARMDESAKSKEEAALLAQGLPYLHEIWHNRHWKVWRVDGFHGLVEGPATFDGFAPDAMKLTVRGPGDIVVHVRPSAQWAVPNGGCATATTDGWTLLRGLQPGPVVVSQALIGTPCPP
jgi:hypothetical protein